MNASDMNIGDQSNQSLIDQLTGLLNRCFVTGLLAIHAGAAQFKTVTNTIQFCINGAMYALAPTDPISQVTGSRKRGGIRVNAQGTGYTLGDVLLLTTTGSLGYAIASNVVSGAVTEVTLLGSGYSYTSGETSATSGGSGTGCTIDVLAVESFVNQPAGSTTYCNYLISLNVDGSVVTTQGPITTVATTPNWVAGSTQANVVPLADCPLRTCPIGYMKIANTTNAYIPGTTNVDAAGVTATFVNLSTVETANKQI